MALFTPGGAEPDGSPPRDRRSVRWPALRPGPQRLSRARSSRSGSRTRASRSSSPTGEARRVVASPGSTPSTGTSPARCSRTRSTLSTRPPTASASSTSRRSASEDGPSAGTSPRWRCSGAPTSSTPPSPARRSRTRRLYDTAYTERYLGLPAGGARGLSANSLIEDAPNLTRPLLLIHGLADDNVFVANTLRLSRALTEAGRLHSVVPLSGITHMTTEESVAENLLLLQVRFLRQALGLEDATTRLRRLTEPPQSALLRSARHAHRRAEIRWHLGRRRRAAPRRRRPGRPRARRRQRRDRGGLGDGADHRRPRPDGQGHRARAGPPRDGHAPDRGRADRDGAPRDRDQRARLPSRQLHGLAGRHHHRHRARPGQDHRDPARSGSSRPSRPATS